MRSFLLLTKALWVVGICQAAGLAAPQKVLHLYGFGERPHVGAQQPVVVFLDELSTEHGFALTHARNQDAVIDIDNYDVVVFNNTGFGAFTEVTVRQKLQDYMTGGGKAIGFRATLDTRNYGWEWWVQDMGGGVSYDDDFFSEYTMDLDAEIETNPALKAAWDANNLGEQVHFPQTEVYVFSVNPRGTEGVTILQTIDPADTPIPDHPYTWLKAVGGGEFIYTALGHQGSDFGTGWVKKATWAWMQYLTGDYDAVGVNSRPALPFARVEKDQIHIVDNGPHALRLFDLQGRLRTVWSGIGEKAHSTQGLDAGVYTLRVNSGHLDYRRPVLIQ